MWFHSFIHSFNPCSSNRKPFFPFFLSLRAHRQMRRFVHVHITYIHKKDLIKHDDPNPFLPSFLPPRSLSHTHSLFIVSHLERFKTGRGCCEIQTDRQTLVSVSKFSEAIVYRAPWSGQPACDVDVDVDVGQRFSY